MFAALAARAAPEDARFGGGAFDGWDRHAMTESAGLDGALVLLSSGTSQTFDFTATPTLAALTIEASHPAGTITNGGTIRLTVPAAWACRFDTGVTVIYGGDDATTGKVDTATFSGDGRTLQIPVTATFEAGDTLIVSGLRLEELRLVSPDTQLLELDFDGDGARDVYDLYALQVRALWPGGAYDGWGRDAMLELAGLTPAAKGTVISFR